MRKLIISIIALFAVVGASQAYTVVEGDWLSKIAEKYNLSPVEMMEINPQITNPDLIYVGDEVNVDIEDELMFGGTKPFAGSTYNLAGAGISSSDTSITLTSLTLKQTDQKISDSDLSDTFYLTVEPGNNTKQEIVACTTVAQNGNGSATLSGCSRGMSPIFPYTASTTMAFTHGGGSQVIFSDPPQLYAEFTAKSNDEQITGTWGFTTTPTSSDTCTASTEFCTKGYIDSGVNQGAATSTEDVGGISELATRAETAAGTEWGSTVPHVIQSQHASSTPGDTAQSMVVVSESDGNINQGWLDLTEDFTFSSSTITNLYVTNATSTARLVVGTAQPSTNDILFVTGNSHFGGNATTTGSMDVSEICFDGGTCETKAGSKFVYADYTQQTVANQAADTTLYSFSLPANTLGTEGILKVKVFVSDFDYEGTGAGGSGISFNLKYDDTTIASVSTGNGDAGASTNYKGTLDMFLNASSSAVLQEGFGVFRVFQTFIQEYSVNDGINGAHAFGSGTGAEDSTTDLTVYVTADWGAADSASSVTTEGIIAEIIR